MNRYVDISAVIYSIGLRAEETSLSAAWMAEQEPLVFAACQLGGPQDLTIVSWSAISA